jgi:hypothetical protein
MKSKNVFVVCLASIIITSGVWWYFTSAPNKPAACGAPPIHAAGDRSPVVEKDIEFVKMDVSIRDATNGYSYEDHSVSFKKMRPLSNTAVNTPTMAHECPSDRAMANTSAASACCTNPMAQNQTPPSITPQPRFEVLGRDKFGERILVLSDHPGLFWYHGCWQKECPQLVPQDSFLEQPPQPSVSFDQQPPVPSMVVAPQPCYPPMIIVDSGGWGNRNYCGAYRQGYVYCAPSVNYGYGGRVSFGYGGRGRGTYSRR